MIKLLTACDIALVERVRAMRSLSLTALGRMYQPEKSEYVFRMRRDDAGAHPEGDSPRYTAIVLIGLARENDAARRLALPGRSCADLCADLANRVRLARPGNPGDIALSYWAARALQCDAAETLTPRLAELLHAASHLPTVETAWIVSALSEIVETGPAAEVRDAALKRLLTAFNPQSGLFSHWTDGGGSPLRKHVSCFADLVYPIQALSRLHRRYDRPDLLAIADRTGREACARIGPDGQWWWHYDARTGRIVEHYPVYAVHQDGMAPMALFDLSEAGGADHLAEIARGWSWLESSPELGGASLIDEQAGYIWRKVARREPRKFVRKAQAVASRIHPAVRLPGVNALFPACVIDDECRPYHLGWLLHAWTEKRLSKLENSLKGGG